MTHYSHFYIYIYIVFSADNFQIIQKLYLVFPNAVTEEIYELIMQVW